MKKTIIIILLTILLLPSCSHSGQTDETTALPLPPAETENYGTDWAYAELDRQIPSDDPDFAVTGAGFEYRDGWLGADENGYFDVAVNYEPGPDESFTFEFDFYAKDNGALWLGFWLYGKDSLYGDGMGGEWIKISDGKITNGGKEYKITSGKAVKLKLSARGDGFILYADGAEIINSSSGAQNGGGAVKLRSDKSPVYIKNLAFKIG